MATCQFCKKTFSTVGSRNYHQKTAKYCLKQRKQLVKKYKCSSCGRLLSSVRSLERHENKCMMGRIHRTNLEQRIETQNEIIAEQRKRIEEYERQIKTHTERMSEIALAGVTKPTHTTTNNIQINGVFNLTPELIQEKISTLTPTHFVNGFHSMVEWIKNELLVEPETGELLYHCTNPKDGMFRFLDQQGRVQRDLQCRKLIKMIQQPLNDQGAKVCAELVEELAQADENDPVAVQRAVERVEKGHSTFMRFRRMKENPGFIRELGVITSYRTS